MSFLQRLKDDKVLPDLGVVLMDNEAQEEPITRLDVDVVQTASSVIIYAQIAGADIQDIHIAIEGENNIVIIEGQRRRPAHLVEQVTGFDGTIFTQECTWCKFYRRIILPESVDIEKTEAKIKNGIMILMMPLLETQEKSRSS